MSRTYPRWQRLLAAIAVIVVIELPAPAAFALPDDELGQNGPCGMSIQEIENPTPLSNPFAAPSMIYVFTPNGSADTPLPGGRCNSTTRPTIFLSHGFGSDDPTAYGAIIRHWVSLGNIVVESTYVSGAPMRADLENTYRQVDRGNIVAVEAEPRIDIDRIGFWGHSHGAGMVPYLVQQAAARGWGRKALWMTSVAQAYSQLVGVSTIPVPAHVRAMFVALQHDEMADARLGIDIFESLSLPDARKDHITINTDIRSIPPFFADHLAPAGAEGEDDAVDLALWRYSDILESCSLRGQNCSTNLTFTGTWPDGTAVRPATVTNNPIDIGPFPAVLAECDTVFGPVLNPRIANCGTTRL